jgi:hypothetical protein
MPDKGVVSNLCKRYPISPHIWIFNTYWLAILGQSINMRLWVRIKHSRIYTRNKWTLNLQAAPLGDYQHRTRPPHWRPTSIKRALHAMGASSLPHPLHRKPALKMSAKKTYDHPACPPCNGCASSPHQRFVASSPFQGQQLPACVHVMTEENSGVSTWVSRTFDIPHCPCKDSREQWCWHVSVSNIRHPTLSV